ncbi:MAG: tetratricopeptide repeat protein, partial [Candidatus Omnitrophica bacterium]|nr:tetratricopeptide repeat protein [Candidatus Omnitrophota bacterium]
FVLSFLKHEYRVYIPLLGLIIVLLETGLLQEMFRRWGRLTMLTGGVIFVLLAAVNWNYARTYRQRIVFWESAVATSPSAPLAHRNLGAMYYLDHRFDAAEAEFLQALKLNPREIMVNNNLGVIYEQRGNPEEAEKAYLREIKINPLYDNVYYNLGLLYASQDRFELATAHWQRAVQLNPRNLMAYKYLAYYYVKSNQPEAAAVYLGELRRRGVVIPDPIDLLIR